MAKYTSIHFDMDGVLANTEPLHVSAEQQTCRDYNFAISPDQWGGFKGQTAEDIFGYLLKNYGDPKTQTVSELIDHKTELFLKMAEDKLEPIEGALVFLQWARNTYQKVTLVTSSNRRVQECIINRFGIAHLFDNIVTGDDISHGKPHPEPYLRSLKQSSSRPESSLVIEDSISGIKSALAANCAVLALATSHPQDELRAADPTFTAANFRNARLLLEQ